MEPCTSPETYTGLAAGEHLFAVLATGPGGTSELAVGGVRVDDRRHHAADHDDHVRAGRPDREHERDVRLLRQRAGRDLPVLARRRRRRALHLAARTTRSSAPGAHRFEVVALSPPMLDAVRRAGRAAVRPGPDDLRVDDHRPRARPTRRSSTGRRPTTASINAYFGFSSDDPTAIIECSLDGAGFSECEPPAVFEDLPAGPHTLAGARGRPGRQRRPDPGELRSGRSSPAPLNTPVGTNVTVELPLPGGGHGDR